MFTLYLSNKTMVKTYDFFEEQRLKFLTLADDIDRTCSLFKKTPSNNKHSELSLYFIFSHEILNRILITYCNFIT